MPRKGLSATTGTTRSRRFNEAGAVMPRKAPPQRIWILSLAGFNEAGAVMPRKGHRRPGAVRPSGAASMRPGQLCPGRGAAALAARRQAAASMRPGQLCPGRGLGQGRGLGVVIRFNEAGAVMPRKATG